MDNTILDDEFETSDNNKASIINWISIMILWAGIGYSTFNGFIGDIRVILSIILLAISTALTYFKYDLGVKVTLGVILVGVFNLVDFFPVKFVIGFGIELLSFLVIIIHYHTNKEVLSPFLKGLINRKITEEEIHEANRSKINGFKKRFSSKRVDELEKIVENDKLVPEAVEAAKELILERTDTEEG